MRVHLRARASLASSGRTEVRDIIARMMEIRTLSLPGDPTGSPQALAPRGRRARAAITDFGRLFGGALVAFLGSVTYLLIRTNWGKYDASDIDSALAGALLVAVPPTVAAWLLLSVAEHQATPGQRRVGLIIARRKDGWRGARQLRMALHPLSLPFWVWLITMLSLLAVPVLPWIVVIWGALVGLGGLSSAVLFAFRPRTPALHDWVARTRVVVCR